jgi:hypothetical protein
MRVIVSGSVPFWLTLIFYEIRSVGSIEVKRVGYSLLE